MKKRIAFVVVLVLLLSTIGALASYKNYSGISLPKVTTAIDPNIFVASDAKNTNGESARNNLQTVVTSSNTQAFRLWRGPGKSVSVTGVRWHKAPGTYFLGIGSTTLKAGYTYNLYARGNTDNTSAVTISGAFDADGGDPI